MRLIYGELNTDSRHGKHGQSASIRFGDILHTPISWRKKKNIKANTESQRNRRMKDLSSYSSQALLYKTDRQTRSGHIFLEFQEVCFFVSLCFFYIWWYFGWHGLNWDNYKTSERECLIGDKSLEVTEESFR